MIDLEIIETQIGATEVNSVDARELHKELGSKREFATWIKKELASLDEGIDYTSFDKSVKRETGGSIRKEYIVTLDVAKSIAMVQRTPKGKAVRQYFIDAEKAAVKYLGKEKLKLEIDKLRGENVATIALLEQKVIDAKVDTAIKLHKALGITFDPVSLAEGEFKTLLPQGIGEALTDSMSDIRPNVEGESTTKLLSDYKVNTHTKLFNDALVELGYLEEYEHKGIKRKLTKKARWFGYNRSASSVNPMPYTVMFYPDRFTTLVEIVAESGYIN